MKTFAALIFCISVILLVYLSGALNQGERYVHILEPVELYEAVECMEICPEHKIVATVPANQKVKMMARLKGKTRIVVRVEYQGQAGWFNFSESVAEFLEEQNEE